ncbi:MAG: DUF5348 domain-containing protein [Bacillota bacterium]
MPEQPILVLRTRGCASRFWTTPKTGPKQAFEEPDGSEATGLPTNGEGRRLACGDVALHAGDPIRVLVNGTWVPGRVGWDDRKAPVSPPGLAAKAAVEGSSSAPHPRAPDS